MKFINGAPTEPNEKRGYTAINTVFLKEQGVPFGYHVSETRFNVNLQIKTRDAI